MIIDLLRLSDYIHRNPIRAGMTRRLADYKWSSYPVYAYNRRCPRWLNTSLILSLFIPSDDVHNAYREKTQEYAEEEKNFSEDIKHGVICGSQAFVDRIKNAYLSGKDWKDVPDHHKIINYIDADHIINAASQVLGGEVNAWKENTKVLNQ